jgi:hypothetical protein
MPSDSLSLHINLRKLLIVLLLTVPLLAADILWTLERTREEFAAASGRSLETLARVAAAGAESFVDVAVGQAREMAARPDVLALVERRNKANQGRTEIQLAALDKVWQTPEAGPEVQRIVATSEALALRAAIERNRLIASVIVTDRFGATAAASHKPTLYYHGDQAWWRIAYGDGVAGADQATPAVWDPVSERDVIAIAVPIRDEAARRVSGVLRVFIPVAGLTAFLEEAQPRPAGDAVIVAKDGRLVVSARADRPPSDAVAEFEALQARILAVDSGWAATHRSEGPELLVGFAATGLGRRYRELDWKVLVSQPMEEASAPLRAVNRRLLLSGALGALLVVILAVYFTNHRAQDLDPLGDNLAKP